MHISENQRFNSIKDNIAKVISTELEKQTTYFKNMPLSAFAIDLEPWDPYFGLCFRKKEEKDLGWDIASWEYFQFSDKNNDGEWQNAREITQCIYDYYNRECAFGRSSNNVTVEIIEVIVESMKAKEIMVAFQGYNFTEDFEFNLINPDDSNQKNYLKNYGIGLYQ